MPNSGTRALDLAPTYDASRYIPCWFTACAGVLSFGILVPVLLALLHTNGQPETFGLWDETRGMDTPVKHPPPESAPEFSKVSREFFELEFAAMLFCGPGAFVLTLMLYRILKSSRKCMDASAMIALGTRWGIVLAFANIPGYLSGAVIGWNNPHVEIRLALLFASAGAVSGAWIGWQAWRGTHPEAGIVPQFSLNTLAVGVIALAALLAVFAPAV